VLYHRLFGEFLPEDMARLPPGEQVQEGYFVKNRVFYTTGDPFLNRFFVSGCFLRPFFDMVRLPLGLYYV